MFVAAFYFLYWIPFSLLPVGGQPVIAFAASLACATAAAVLFWRTSRRARARDGAAPGPWASILTGALGLGALGFVLGFFGPLLLTPESNQGPLLGLFVTGPLGVVLGGLGGYVTWLVKRRRPA